MQIANINPISSTQKYTTVKVTLRNSYKYTDWSVTISSSATDCFSQTALAYTNPTTALTRQIAEIIAIANRDFLLKMWRLTEIDLKTLKNLLPMAATCTAILKNTVALIINAMLHRAYVAASTLQTVTKRATRVLQ